MSIGASSSASYPMRATGGAVCVEVEDRAYEATLNDRKRALRQSRGYLQQFNS
jgi:hypothetical protein